MPIDPYLARGITPLGAGLGDTVEMMNQMRNRNSLTQDARMRTDAYTQDVNNRQMSAEKEQEARAKYAEMVGLSNAPPEYQAKYVDMQKAQHPEFMQTPFAQMDKIAAFKAMRDALAAQLDEKPPEPPPVQPTFVNDRSGYSYGWDPTQGVLPGSMQQPQRAPQTGPTSAMQDWNFRSRLPPDQRAEWDAQHGAGSGGSPSFQEIVDPTNPKQLLRVDGKTYQGGGMGSPGVLGVSGKEPTAAKAAEKQGVGREAVDSILVLLRDNYQQLDQAGGITNPAAGPLQNVGAYASSSGLGQATGKLFGTKNQSLRNEIAQTRPRLLSAIMSATGMSSRQLDSNAELKLWLSAATDPTLDVKANLAALDNIGRLYGTTASEAPKDDPLGIR